MGWGHLLRVRVYLPRAQPILFAVCARHFSDNCTDDDDDDNASRPDDHEQHAKTGGVQALLRTELGQLVLQMHVGLLCSVLTMYRSDQHHCLNNDHDDDRHDINNNEHTVAAALQVMVR